MVRFADKEYHIMDCCILRYRNFPEEAAPLEDSSRGKRLKEALNESYRAHSELQFMLVGHDMRRCGPADQALPSFQKLDIV